MNPTKKGIFIHKHPTDVKVIIDQAVNKYGCSWLAYCIQDVKYDAKGKPYTQTMNRFNILSDKWLRELVEQSERKLKIFVYANILASDTDGESKAIVKRIQPYVNKPAFGGVILRLRSDVVREGALIERLVRLIRIAYPGITIGSAHDSPRHDDAVKSLLHNTDFHMPLVSGKADTLYKEFHSAYVYIGTYSKKPIYPIASISDIPALNYQVDTAKVKAFWQTQMSDETMAAVGLWNWYPEDPQVVRMTMDGEEAAEIKQLVKGLKWTRTTTTPPVTPPVVEPPVTPPPVIPEYTRDENIDHLIAYAKAQRWIP